MKRAVAAALAGCLALRAGAAAAQESTPPVVGPPAPIEPLPVGERWYGWQTLSADAGAVGLFALAAGLNKGSPTAAGTTLTISLGTFVLGGPIVHAAHGHWGKAGISLALRLVLPLLGWAAGFGGGEGACNDPDHASCGTDAVAAFTTLLGVVAAVAVDAAALGREPSYGLTSTQRM